VETRSGFCHDASRDADVSQRRRNRDIDVPMAKLGVGTFGGTCSCAPAANADRIKIVAASPTTTSGARFAVAGICIGYRAEPPSKNCLRRGCGRREFLLPSTAPAKRGSPAQQESSSAARPWHCSSHPKKELHNSLTSVVQSGLPDRSFPPSARLN
jgi:hypothetical protein